MSKILIATDDWHPHISGVVTTLSMLQTNLISMGYNVDILHPRIFSNIGLPVYKKIRLCNPLAVIKWLKDKDYDHIHVATPEGSVGYAVCLYCRSHKLKYTTAYHTRIPEYAHKYSNIPLMFGYMYERMVHKNSEHILVTTESMKKELLIRGFDHEKMVIWQRGVDRDLFSPSKDKKISPTPGTKIILYVGRISKEKNIEDVLNLKFTHSNTKWLKVIVGDGPYKKELEKRYYKDESVYFAGAKVGENLASYYTSADVFVFPSQTDTFGLVMLEAISSGTPVAAYNVTGPTDIIEYGINGYYGDNLEDQIELCLLLDRERIRASSDKWSWRQTAIKFSEYIVNTK